jgi:hypothetical protein
MAMNALAPSLAPARPHRVLLTLVFALPLAAQTQFAESHKTHVPQRRDTSRTVRAADFDGDGDRDLLFGNSDIIGGAQNTLLRNNGAGDFTDVTATHLPAGLWHTSGLAVGDVDGDGDLDFVTGDTWQNRLFRNDGTGRFTDATFGRMPTQASETRHLELADFDGDNDLDLVCANYRQETLYLNNGSGVFTDVTATHLPPDQMSTWELGVADIDGDGDLDLGFANHGLRRLYRNDGSAHFTDITATHLPGTETNVSCMLFADIDGDNDKDLFLGRWDTQGALYRNDGTGQFTDISAGRLPATPPYHWNSVFGDVDGDGDRDLIYTTIFTDRLFLNDGTGTFSDAPAGRLPQVTSTTIDTVLADLDGDADLDWVTADVGQHDRVYWNDGSGTFADVTPQRLDAPWVGMLAMGLADLDADGDLDLVAVSGDYGEAVEADSLFRNDGRGNFTHDSSGRLPSVLDDTQALALGDVDGDGDVDLVFGNLRQQSRLFLNNGSAVFTDVTASHLPAATPATRAVALGDVDGDGDRDLVLGNYGEPSRLYLNSGAGVFTDVSAARLPPSVRETRAVALGDLDGDGDLDILFGNGLSRNEQETLLINNGSGTFADETATRLPSAYVFATASLALGDVDRDGDLDIAVGNDDFSLGRFNRLYRNDGSGRFTDEDLIYDYYRTMALAFGDADGDGDLDAFCGDYDHYDKLYLNDGTGTFANVSWPRMPATYERTRALALGDVDGDGDLDLVRGSDWNHATVLMNHHRQVWSPRMPKIGTTWVLEVFASTGYATQAQTALPFLAAAPASLQIGTWGKLGLDPVSLFPLPLLPLPAPAGKASLSLMLPNTPALAGATFFTQALVLHNNSLVEARFTNVLAEKIVR